MHRLLLLLLFLLLLKILVGSKDWDNILSIEVADNTFKFTVLYNYVYSDLVLGSLYITLCQLVILMLKFMLGVRTVKHPICLSKENKLSILLPCNVEINI